MAKKRVFIVDDAVVVRKTLTDSIAKDRDLEPVGSASNGNVSLIVGVTKDLTNRIQAGKVVGAVAQKVGGKGGGRPDLAEAGGKHPEALDSALGEVYTVVDSLLGS